MGDVASLTLVVVDGGRDVTSDMVRNGYRCTDACIAVVPRGYEFTP
jgi:hypothetical protein